MNVLLFFLLLLIICLLIASRVPPGLFVGMRSVKKRETETESCDVFVMILLSCGWCFVWSCFHDVDTGSAHDRACGT